MVMKILYRKMLRELKQAFGQFISILAIITIGVMIYTGLNSTYRDLSLASSRYMEDCRLADLFCTFSPTPESVIGRLESLPYVKAVTGRAVQQVRTNVGGNSAELRIITLPDTKRKIVNDILITDGSYFSDAKSSQCLVEQGFYQANGLKPGDFLYPVINGSRVRLEVCGSVMSPEYVYPLKDAGEIMPNFKKFGIVYVKESFGRSVFGLEGAVNSAGLLLLEGVDPDKAKEDIKRAFEKFGLLEATLRRDQLSCAMLTQEIDGLKKIGGTAPVIFFIVAAVIIYIMMGRLVEDQRVQIGVLKALGYYSFRILSHYLSYSMFLGMAGSIAGTAFGMLLGKAFTSLENKFFNLPLSTMKIYPELALPASAITLFFCLLAGYNSCKSVLGIMPGEAMRPKAPASGKRIMLEGLQSVWCRLGYVWRMVLRNLFRYKKRALLTSVGVVFCVNILMLAFCMEDSINFMINQQYGNIQNYDIKVAFNKFIDPSVLREVSSISHVKKTEPFLETGVEIRKGWVKKNIGYTALVEKPAMYRAVDKDGRPLPSPANGILIPERLAEILDAEVGDQVMLKPLLPGMEEKAAVIKGTAAQYLGTAAYGTIKGAGALFGEGELVNGVVLGLDSPAHVKEVLGRLEEMPAVNSAQSKNDSLEALLQNIGAMQASVGLIIILAAVLSVAVVYNLASINIYERRRELATLKVMGLSEKEVRRVINRENLVVTGIGTALGVPSGILLCIFVMSTYSTDFYNFPTVTTIASCMLSVAATLAFTCLANLMLRRKIRRIDMVGMLKSSE